MATDVHEERCVRATENMLTGYATLTGASRKLPGFHGVFFGRRRMRVGLRIDDARLFRIGVSLASQGGAKVVAAGLAGRRLTGEFEPVGAVKGPLVTDSTMTNRPS